MNGLILFPIFDFSIKQLWHIFLMSSEVSFCNMQFQLCCQEVLTETRTRKWAPKLKLHGL
jgi:hypothetical protein